MNRESYEEVNRAFLELEQCGLLERTGELRNGQPVWVTTAFSKHLEETEPEQLKLIMDLGPTDDKVRELLEHHGIR